MNFDKYRRSLVVCIIMLTTMLLLSLTKHPELILPAKPLNTFPMTIGEWKGVKERFEDKIYDVLGVDDSILATYKNNSGQSVNLYIGFYQSQREGDIIHSPKNCLPGSGWNITETSIETIEIPENSHNKQIKVIRLDLEKDSQKYIVLYWFHSRGRIISSEYMQKVWLVIDSITKNRTDEAFVRLVSPVVDGEISSLERIKKFAKEILPYLNEYIPS